MPDREFAPDPRRLLSTKRSAYPDRFIDRIRDRLQPLRGDPRAGVALLVLVAVVAGFLWYRAGAGSGESEPPARDIAQTAPSTTVASAPASSGVVVVVHIAGAVKTSGVVELATGTRVIDAIEAAGGGLPEADLDRLNLAANLLDGQRVYVPRVGEAAAPPIDPAAAPASDGLPGALLALNTATAAQLEALPGIGPQLAAAIIAERDRRGGFRSVNELRDVDGIGDKRFAVLKDKVTV